MAPPSAAGLLNVAVLGGGVAQSMGVIAAAAERTGAGSRQGQRSERGMDTFVPAALRGIDTFVPAAL